MTQVKLGRSFFLVSFLPAILYWYLEAHYPVRTALIGGLTLSVIELSIEYFWTKEIHALSKFNFILIAVLGGLSLSANEGVWFKLQPFFTGIFMSCFMFYQLKKVMDYFCHCWSRWKPLPLSSCSDPWSSMWPVF